MKSIIIGIAGGTGSGKTTLTERLRDHFGADEVSVLNHDSYYKRHDELPYEERCKLNYDHPDSFDTELLVQHLQALRRGESVKVPVYDYTIHNRSDKTITVHPAPVIIVEGILIFASQELCDMMDMKVFVDTDADVRILRRIVRDVKERGRTKQDDWLPSYKATRKDGLYCLITCNHDTIRPSAGLTPDELKIAYAMLFTLPGAPFVYYGDEIGMRYLPLPTKEGGYFRTGSRTPMQWDNSANKGFSTAAADKLYLPVDDAADAPTVAAQQADPDSLWHTVQGVLNFRHSHRDLDSDAPFHVRFAPKAKGSYRPFAWERGKLICAVNPAREEAELPLKLEDGTRVLHVIGKAEVKGDELVLGAQSFAILG